MGLSLESLSHFTEYWNPQEEMLILLTNVKVFLPGIISSDGVRKD